eukprot:1054784-Amphidinium_carterae.1
MCIRDRLPAQVNEPHVANELNLDHSQWYLTPQLLTARQLLSAIQGCKARMRAQYACVQGGPLVDQQFHRAPTECHMLRTEAGAPVPEHSPAYASRGTELFDASQVAELD